jgi:NitT/TauT family transport system permease protein
MNAVVAEAKIAAAGGGLAATLNESWNHARPVIPAPHQIVVELWNTVFTIAPWKVKSLLYHCWVTLSSTLLGFHPRHAARHRPCHPDRAFEAALEGADAVDHRLADHSHSRHRADDHRGAGGAGLHRASAQIADLHVSLLLPRHHRHGERPELAGCHPPRPDAHLQCQSASEVLWKLRLPASVPYLFASLKIAIAIALTGAIVGELPTGAMAGIGARLLVGSYNGLT